MHESAGWGKHFPHSGHSNNIIMMKKKIIGIITAVLVIALAATVYFKFYFVFGEGVKAGELNFVVYKGYLSRHTKAGPSRQASAKARE